MAIDESDVDIDQTSNIEKSRNTSRPRSDRYTPCQRRNQKRSGGSVSSHKRRDREAFFGESSTFPFVSNSRADAAAHIGLQGSPASDEQGQAIFILGDEDEEEDDENTVYESTCTPRDAESLFELPERRLADILVDAYFGQVHALYPFLHEGTFRTEYELLWERPSVSRFNTRLPWFGVLNMVFAHACQFGDAFVDDDTRSVASTYVRRSRCLILCHVFKLSSIETVQSLLLMCYYLQGTVELNECWNLLGIMTRTAISLGLHLTPTVDSLKPIEKEVRKRVWWGCFVIDQSLSMKFGRPPTLRAQDNNVELPLEVDDQYITHDCVSPRQPTGSPSVMSFFTASIKLSYIICSMLKSMYLGKAGARRDHIDNALQIPVSGHHSILSSVVLLDGQLQSWWDTSPDHLTLEAGDPPRNKSDILRQRFILKIRQEDVKEAL